MKLSKKEKIVLENIRKQIPEVKIKYKEDSLFFRILIRIFPWFAYYWTTIGNTIYKPKNANGEFEVATLIHECAHILQYNRGKLKFIFQYLFPQSVSIFILPFLVYSIITLSYALLPAILFLITLCLLPYFDATYRARYEHEAIDIQFYFLERLNYCLTIEDVQSRVKDLSGKNYYWAVTLEDNKDKLRTNLVRSMNYAKNVADLDFVGYNKDIQSFARELKRDI